MEAGDRTCRKQAVSRLKNWRRHKLHFFILRFLTLSRGDLRWCFSTYLLLGMCSPKIDRYLRELNIYRLHFWNSAIGGQPKRRTVTLTTLMTWTLFFRLKCGYSIVKAAWQHRHAYFLTLQRNTSCKTQQWVMALLIQQVSLSRYFNTVEENGEISTNYLLLFVGGSLSTFVTTSPPEQNCSSYTWSKLSAGHRRSLQKALWDLALGWGELHNTPIKINEPYIRVGFHHH